jgi:hypothetical protein
LIGESHDYSDGSCSLELRLFSLVKHKQNGAVRTPHIRYGIRQQSLKNGTRFDPSLVECLSLPKTPFRTARRKTHSFCSRAIACAASCIWSISQLLKSDRCRKKPGHEARVLDCVAYRHSRNERASGCSSLIAVMEPTYLRQLDHSTQLSKLNSS